MARVPWRVDGVGRPPDPRGVDDPGGAGSWLGGRVPRLDLAELLRPHPTAVAGTFVLEVPDGLQQGRGAWGGVASGAMTAAAQLVDPRPDLSVRSVSAQLVAPVPVGPARVVVEELRRGSATNTLAARVLDDAGRLLAHGVVVLGGPRQGQEMPDGPAWLTVAPPPALAAGPDAVAASEVEPPLAPAFTRHLEFRPVEGLLFSGEQSDQTSGWIRPREPVAWVDASVVVALADAWWITAMVRMPRPRPAATIGFSVELAGDPAAVGRAADGRMEALFHRGRTISARDGYVVEVRELWTRWGTLLSWNTQTVAVIK